MFVLVYGKDSYRAKQKVKALIEKENGSAVQFFDFIEKPDFSFLELKELLGSRSLFDKSQVIVLRDVLAEAGFKEGFLKQAKDLKDLNDLVIFFEANKIPDQDVVSFFKKFGRAYKFDDLNKSQLRQWLKKEVEKLGLKIDSSALAQLISFIGDDLWRLSLELKKLAAFKTAEKKITSQDIALLVKPKIDTHIFKTIDALAQKDKKTALNLLYNHLEAGEHPLYLLAMFNYQFRNLLMVKDLEDKSLPEVQKTLKPLHPFVVQKSYQFCQKFSPQELKKIYSKLFKMDLAVKKGKIKPELALELLIADV